MEGLDEEAREGVRGVYAVLDTLPIDEQRGLFAARAGRDGETHGDVARSCGCLLARDGEAAEIARAEEALRRRLRTDNPRLSTLLRGGGTIEENHENRIGTIP